MRLYADRYFRGSRGVEKQIGYAVVLSPVILKILIMWGTIEKSCARAKLGEIALARDWLGRPIYRYAMKYFDYGLSDCNHPKKNAEWWLLRDSP